jgi:hypothetical protein
MHPTGVSEIFIRIKMGGYFVTTYVRLMWYAHRDKDESQTQEGHTSLAKFPASIGFSG